MGREADQAELSAGQWFEAGMTQWLCEFFERLNVTHEVHEIEPNRANVIARIEGDPAAPTVLLDAHQDTVPVPSQESFCPIEKDGRLYGRGACDVKGAMAAILSTVAELKASDSREHASVIVSCTCDEERGQKGARNLISQFEKPLDERSPLLKQLPHMAIISEPTELNVVVAHKGTVRWKVATGGVAAHSSDPTQGRNAIYAMAEVVQALQQYATELSNSSVSHPLCGRPTLSVGRIEGGKSVNIVPDACIIEIDRRVVPGELLEDVMPDAERFVRERCAADFEFLPPDTTSRPLVDDANIDFAQQLSDSTKRIAGVSSIIGVPFATHAPRFAATEIPTVVYGPGSIRQAHTDDEWIDLNQLDLAKRCLLQFLKGAV